MLTMCSRFFWDGKILVLGRVEAITMNHRWFWDRWLRGNWSVHSLLSILSILRNMHLRVWVFLVIFLMYLFIVDLFGVELRGREIAFLFLNLCRVHMKSKLLTTFVVCRDEWILVLEYYAIRGWYCIIICSVLFSVKTVFGMRNISYWIK